MRSNDENRHLITLSEVLTTVTHAAVLGFAFFVLYIAFSNEVDFFAWHPILLTVGWMLTAIEGILAISSKNRLTQPFNFQLKVRSHWVLQAITILCTAVGFIIVVINKNEKNKHHFQTWHAILGLITVILCGFTGLGGVLALYNQSLKNYLVPNLNKVFHTGAGIVTFVFGSITMVLGLYTKWFTRKSTEATQFACAIIVIFAVVWTLVHPTRTFLRRLR